MAGQYPHPHRHRRSPPTRMNRLPKETCRLVVIPAGVGCRRRYWCDGAVASGTAPHVEQHMAVPAPPMSRATSSQHPATTASATADGAVAGGDALPGDDDAPGAPRQEAEEAVVEATDRAEGVVEASEAALAPPAPQPPAGHADLLVAMLTGALRAVAGGGHMHYHVRVLAGRPSCVDCGQRTDWECCCDGTPALCGPKYPCMATHQRAVLCPTTATVRAEFRHVRDAFHDATRAAVCEASEKARAAGRVRRVRRRTAQELKESETCRQ
mmetsp:Transcript_25380/g.65364  ORF Transcript_25380/g.65364 Transcript_25380/m.65364 type:complete len:269 (-) Transcript_25380:64-870(-)